MWIRKGSRVVELEKVLGELEKVVELEKVQAPVGLILKYKKCLSHVKRF